MDHHAGLGCFPSYSRRLCYLKAVVTDSVAYDNRKVFFVLEGEAPLTPAGRGLSWPFQLP